MKWSMTNIYFCIELGGNQLIGVPTAQQDECGLAIKEPNSR